MNITSAIALLTADQTYQSLELTLYLLAFFILVLIFLFIAYERPSEEQSREKEK